MLNEQDLKDLLAYRPTSPVLSVFLDLDPTAGSATTHKLRLRQMLKEFAAAAPQDVERIDRYLEHEFGWRSRSLALFSCAAEDVFRPFPLAVPLRSRARRIDRPYVKPLADLLDSYGDYGVALVDRQGARLFHFHLGELQEQQGTMGEAVRRAKRGGASALFGRRGGTAGPARGDDDVADRNLKDAARFAASFFQEKRVRRVLIGGTDENAGRFTALLPKTLQSLVLGTFPMEMTATASQVLDKAMDVALRAERDREDRMVDAVITASAKGHDGVLRLEETLSAVHAGRVQTLLVSDGFRAPGFVCDGCRHLTAHRLARCPFCGGSFHEIEDAVELAVRHVLAAGGDVEVVHNHARLKDAGSIGALLRY
jgi:peptide subunit release factor 1 (eRF1)